MTDWSGTDYRQLSALQDAVAAAALQRFAPLVQRGDEAVLDIGCGDGRRTAEVADLVPRGTVVGIDPSPRMIAVAQERARPGLRFALARAQDLDATAEVDLVLSLNALHWVPRPELPGVLDRVHRALRPGGRALIQLVGATERRSLEQTAMDVAHSGPWRPWFADFPAPFTHPTAAELTGWAAAAGFAGSEADQTEHTWSFPSPAAFAQWAAMGFGSWTGRLPDQTDRDRFVRAVVAAYAGPGEESVFRFSQLRVVLDRL